MFHLRTISRVAFFFSFCFFWKSRITSRRKENSLRLTIHFHFFWFSYFVWYWFFLLVLINHLTKGVADRNSSRPQQPHLGSRRRNLVRFFSVWIWMLVCFYFIRSKINVSLINVCMSIVTFKFFAQFTSAQRGRRITDALGLTSRFFLSSLLVVSQLVLSYFVLSFYFLFVVFLFYLFI